MPKLMTTADAETRTVQFVASPSLDLMNAMYFTSLVPQMEGVEGWPVQLRQEMAPDLRDELDFLFNYPAGDPGLMGILADNLFALPETWRDVDALTSYVESTGRRRRRSRPAAGRTGAHLPDGVPLSRGRGPSRVRAPTSPRGDRDAACAALATATRKRSWLFTTGRQSCAAGWRA